MNPFKAVTSSPLVKIFLTLTVAVILIAILPDTPFMSFLEEMEELPYLGYLNWIMPIGRCAAVMSAWWTCVVVYYGIRWILAQLGIVGGGGN